MAVQKIILRALFMAWMDAKDDLGQPSRSRFGLAMQTQRNAKAVFKNNSTNADDVDLIHEDLDQIDDLDLEEMDINWQIAMTAIKIKKFYKKTGRRPRVDGKMHVGIWIREKVECSIRHITGHFVGEQVKSTKDGSRQEEASRGQDFKPVRTEKEALMTIDEGQINWVEQTTDEELNHALMAFTVNNEVSMCSKLCLDSFNALKAKYDELQSEFGDQEAALTAHKLDKDALQKIVDSWFASSKNLWKLIDCGMSSTVKIGLGYGIQSNAEVLSYEEEMDRGIFVLKETDPGYNDIPLYRDLNKCNDKGVPPHPLSGDYTPREQEDIDDSSVCICDGEPGTVSDHSVNDDPVSTQKTQPKVPTPTQTVDPSCAQHVKPPRQPIKTPVTSSPIPSYKRQNWNQRMERELGAGYSFERGGNHKMAREAALKSQRVVHADVRQATPAWTNTNRVNKANQFTPRPVQLSNIRPNFSTASRTIKTGRVNVNTGKQNVSSGSKHVNAGSVHFNSGTQFKSGASRFNTGKQHVNSGRMYVNSGTQNKSGSSRVNTGKQNVNTARVNRPVLSNQTSQDSSSDDMEIRVFLIVDVLGTGLVTKAILKIIMIYSKVGICYFWRKSKGFSDTWKSNIRLGNLVFDDVAFVKELGHFNLFSISQICDKKLNVLFTEKECFVVSSDFKMPDENQVLLKVPRQHNMYTFDMKNVDSSKGYTCLLAKALISA
ncbi:hypothetical protein Tco_1091460 [Tanacetum coccineum]|uniref:Uncharacterized protein n=1 Tax=Tanacetum coccineum TaxID=301880 RepID=A0ABQ5I723_9ASTR